MINNCKIKTYDAYRSMTVPQQYRKGAYLLRALLRTPWLDWSIFVALTLVPPKNLIQWEYVRLSRANSTTCACQVEMGPLRITIYPFERQAFTILNTSFAFYTIKCYSSSDISSFSVVLTVDKSNNAQKKRWHRQLCRTHCRPDTMGYRLAGIRRPGRKLS